MKRSDRNRECQTSLVLQRRQGCQMVRFQTKQPNLGKFWRVLQWKMLVYFMETWSILQSFVILMEIWYSSSKFGIFFPLWYFLPRKIWQPRLRQRLFTDIFDMSTKTTFASNKPLEYKRSEIPNDDVGRYKHKIAKQNKSFWSMKIVVISIWSQSSEFTTATPAMYYARAFF
jgi:hypothetical protein